MVPKLNKLDIAIEYSCNLACKGCIAFSNYNRSGTLYPSTAKKYFEQWHNKIQPDEIALFGGEPLLNKNVGPLLLLVRQYWPNARIKINTNVFNLEADHIQHLFDVGNAVLQATFHFGEEGIRNKLKTKLLDIIKPFGKWDMEQDTEDVCFLSMQNKDVTVRCVQYGEFVSPAKGHGKNLRPWNSNNVEDSISLCGNPSDPIMFEGRLYKCSPLANLKDTLSLFNIDHVDEWQPYLTYKGIGPNDDIENFVANVGKASWMCSMCADNSSDLATYSHLEKGGVEFKNA